MKRCDFAILNTHLLGSCIEKLTMSKFISIVLIFFAKKLAGLIDENKEEEVGIGELLREGVYSTLESFDIKQTIAKEFKVTT